GCFLFAAGTINRHILPNNRPVADYNIGFLTLEFDILGLPSQNSTGRNLATLAQNHVFLQYRIRPDFGIVTDLAMRTDVAERSYLHIGAQFGGGINNGIGVNIHTARPLDWRGSIKLRCDPRWRTSVRLPPPVLRSRKPCSWIYQWGSGTSAARI